MNPILLNPKGAHQSQVIVPGRPRADCTAGDYYDSSDEIMKEVERANSRLAREFDIIMRQIL